MKVRAYKHAHMQAPKDDSTTRCQGRAPMLRGEVW